MTFVAHYGKKENYQDYLIGRLNKDWGVLPSIQNGFCYALSLEWILMYLDVVGKIKTTPCRILDRITGDSALVRQIAMAYNTLIVQPVIAKLHPGSSDGDLLKAIFEYERTTEVVERMSKGARTVSIRVSTARIKPVTMALAGIQMQIRTEALLILFWFENKGKQSGHAIAMVKNGAGDYSIYDPNGGIYYATHITDVFTTLIPTYTDKPESVWLNVLAVQ